MGGAAGAQHAHRFQRRLSRMLRHIAAPPPLLFVVGTPPSLREPPIAIVGTRNPTPGGRRSAEDFASDLAASGIAIVSGLAPGIDAEAPRGALKAGGVTIAVEANGLDRVYPPAHR